MKLALQQQTTSTRRFTGLYIAALGAVALFSIIGQVVIQFSLMQQSGDARVINIAGRQRMLSQKLSKAAEALYIITDDVTARGTRIDEVRTTLAAWERAHQGLQHGDAQLNLDGKNSAVVNRLFTLIQPNFEAMRTAAHSLLDKVSQDQSASIETQNKDILPFVRTLLTQEGTFLPGMDNIVKQYQNEAEARVGQLRIVELTLLGLTLLILLLEGTLIFRPAIGKLRRSMSELGEAEKQVGVQLAELERKNSELELAFNEAMVAHRKVMPHARVVAFGHYQVQGAQGNYYTVTNRDINGSELLECECPMYRRNLICSHSLAAASLHSALLRQTRQSSSSPNQSQTQAQPQNTSRTFPRRQNFFQPDTLAQGDD